jgi:hypothetical protein
MMLFLDFDGVLHPDNVRLVQYGYGEPRVPEMVEPGFELFCWAANLVQLLEELDPDGQVKIILSTSWVKHFGDFAAEYLPPALRERVTGVVAHNDSSRGVVVASNADSTCTEPWIALDDDDLDWPEEHLHRLVRCERMLGLSDPRVMQELRAALEGVK